MIFDRLLTVSSAQAVTASAVSTDVIDLSKAIDIGEGEDLYMHFSVDTAVTAAGAATVEFQVIGSTAAAMSSPVVLGSSGPIAKTALVAGAQIAVRINPSIGSLGLRYLSANYSVATGPLTAGAFTAGIVHDIQDGKKSYASGYSVL
ncbi:MAG: hypothetical protein EB060_10980 [Proteobacteria bacterium]|nr:hypothetical protein [Pseudomonadota bacterium]